MKAMPASRPTGRLRFHAGGRISARSIAQDLAARALTTFYRRMAFMTYRLADRRIPEYRARIPVEFGMLSHSHIEHYLRFRPDVARRQIEDRLSHNQRCFVSWHEGRIIDACWTATESAHVPYLNRYIRIPPGDIYSYDSFTAREYRACGIYMARNSFTARLNQSEGFRRSIALVAVENVAAWLILTRSGLNTAGTYHYLRTPVRGTWWQTSGNGVLLPVLSANRGDCETPCGLPAPAGP